MCNSNRNNNITYTNYPNIYSDRLDFFDGIVSQFPALNPTCDCEFARINGLFSCCKYEKPQQCCCCSCCNDETSTSSLIERRTPCQGCQNKRVY